VDGLRISGHPVHPALVHFPIALWTVSLASDGAALATRVVFWTSVAWWSLVVGLIVAALAAVAGFLDYSRLTPKHPAFRTATAHVLIMTFVSLCFLASALLRPGPDVAPGVAALVCSGIGFVALLAGAWLGGTLVYRFGVGVELPSDR
jgi:uncharacterized membrane protein